MIDLDDKVMAPWQVLKQQRKGTYFEMPPERMRKEEIYWLLPFSLLFPSSFSSTKQIYKLVGKKMWEVY